MLLEPNPPVIPSAYMWDGNEVTDQLYGNYVSEMAVTVDLFDLVPKETAEQDMPRKANELLSDGRKAMLRDADTGAIDLTINGLAEWIKYTGCDTLYGVDPLYWTGVSMEFLVRYQTAKTNPNEITAEE